MDTITHGIAGALIGKAIFRGDDLFAIRPMNSQRLITWSLMLGAIFPDADTFRDVFSHNQLLMITWHRSITHSLLMLPLWAVLLAFGTQQFARWRRWDSPSFAKLTAIYAVGILSHILLDLVTTFGTMIWSPLEWSRPAWDLLFIVDFTFTAILLIPQLLAWAYANPEKIRTRAIAMWFVFLPAPLIISKIAQIVGAPISDRAILTATFLFTLLFLVPVFGGLGAKISHSAWNRAGLIAACAYITLTIYAHSVALTRIKQFAAFQHVEVQSIAALPFPPSLLNWDGLVRVPDGVYEMRIDLSKEPAITGVDSGHPVASSTISYSFFPDAFSNAYINSAKLLPEVQKVLWFARFPVTHFHKEGRDAIVEFSDVRFPKIRPDRPQSFTYRVRMGSSGEILSQGWVR
jgi:membrane-bound metal-dependent hydrolase YbcI (DUF457 family)